MLCVTLSAEIPERDFFKMRALKLGASDFRVTPHIRTVGFFALRPCNIKFTVIRRPDSGFANATRNN